MEPKDPAAPSDASGALSTEHIGRIFGSLESRSLGESFQSLCSELLGSCEARVYTYVADDHARVARFGEEEPRSLPAPPPAEVGLFGGSATAVEPGPSGESQWRALLPLDAESQRVGLLELTMAHPLDSSRRPMATALSLAFAVAVRNSQIFEKTKQLTFTDDLTALYNSRFMALYLDRELKRCRRARSSLSLLFMDLDGFKNINDTHGHLAGSKTLVEVGLVLERTVRDADVLIRYGGDEFVILFPETPLSGGLVIAERIRQVIGNTRFLESQQIEARVSASIGIAAYPETAEDVRGLISSADRAMYEAKALGKNRVVAAPPLPSPESPKRP